MVWSEYEIRFLRENGEEIDKLRDLHKERFGKMFPAYNSVVFPWTDEITGPERYLETLRKSIADNQPFVIPEGFWDDYLEELG